MLRVPVGTGRAVIAGAILLASAAGSLPALAGTPPCTVPDAIKRLGAPTPTLARTFNDGGTIRIVAFGSSSTEGAGASARERTYPARLGAALRRMLPGRRFEIINRGRGGELASDMLARLERDVIATDPTLVIWQTGVNDAIHGVDLAAFRSIVEDGLRRLRLEAIDVVLLDPQYYPGAKTVKSYMKFLTALRTIGAAHGVPVFRRYHLMAHLVDSGQFEIDELLAPDRFHQNDLSYNCLGTVLAEAFHNRFKNGDLKSAPGTGEARNQ